MIPSQDPAFDRMVNTARILIIDHDINRYHSFELYSYLLTKREYFFNSIDKPFLIDFINQSTELHVIPTDISDRLSPLLYNESVEGYLLKYSFDNHKSSYEDQVKVFKSEHILDGTFATEIIRKFKINTVFVSSIDLAILISLRLYQLEYKDPITFYVGIYRYNYDPETKSMKHTSAVAGLEYAVKHSFMSIDPFTSLSYDKESQYDVYEEEGD